jgi:1-acyl-sn-glycerol-3-phosphate acyltransferase
MIKRPTLLANVPTNNSKFVPWFAFKILRLLNWNIVGELPNSPKFILVVAPHTSNWDFFYGLLVKFSLDLKVNFLGKDSIFIWPLSLCLRSAGGIAINRRSANGVVGQLVTEFANKQQLVLAMAPEGTRSKVSKWKTGFLHIAKAAKVKVIPVQMDFANKQVVFLPARAIVNDIEQELIALQGLFHKDCAKKPQNF